MEESPRVQTTDRYRFGTKKRKKKKQAMMQENGTREMSGIFIFVSGKIILSPQ